MTTRRRKRSKMAARLSSLGTSFDAPNIESSGTSWIFEPLANLRSFRMVRSEFKIAEFDLKISSRKTISASGSMVSVLRV